MLKWYQFEDHSFAIADKFLTWGWDNHKKRNVKKSDLKLDEVVEEIQEDEFTCSVCFLVLKNTQLEKPRAKVCIDCA